MLTMIPKIIYQTWDTYVFPDSVQSRLDIISKMYKGYEYKFFLDEDMDNFVKEHYSGEILECYNKLNIIVAKADFWRYLILYKFGGIYLDIDSDLKQPLDQLIHENDDAIIAAESNPNTFVQWALIFQAGHPILERTIDMVVDNIKHNRYPNDIHKMTGPSVFTAALQSVHKELYGKEINHQSIRLGDDIIYQKHDVKYRIYGIDYNEHFHCKIPECFDLFAGREKWHKQQKNKSLLNI